MMAQATRDPIFHACLAIANQDIGEAGELCVRCHSPTGWIDGRSTPTDGFSPDPLLGDFDGVNCHTWHRRLDIEYDPNTSPSEDLPNLHVLCPRRLGGRT